MPINMPDEHPEANLRKLTCGSCQWFTAGYKGSNCRKTRDVEPMTPACVEYTPIFEDPYHEASKDKYLVGVSSEIASEYYQIDQSIIKEMKDYIVNLEGAVGGMGRNAESNALNNKLKEIVAYRARVTTVTSDIIEIKSFLSEKVDNANMWLYSKYPFMMELRNEEQRRAAFDRILPTYRPVKTSLDRLQATVDLIDSKLDKNERTIRSILEANIKLVYSTDRIK